MRLALFVTLRSLFAGLALLTSVACDNGGTEPEGGRTLMTANINFIVLNSRELWLP